MIEVSIRSFHMLYVILFLLRILEAVILGTMSAFAFKKGSTVVPKRFNSLPLFVGRNGRIFSRERRSVLIKAAGNTFGHSFRVTTFGESHGGGVGCVVDGVPARLQVDKVWFWRNNETICSM